MVQVYFQSAEDIASKMKRASDSINLATNKTYVKAYKTTVTVNNEAQLAHEELIQLSKQFNVSFNKTIEQLHTVKSEFERTDIELHNNMNQLLRFSNQFQK